MEPGTVGVHERVMGSGSEEPSTPMSDNHEDAPKIGFLGVFGALTDDDPLRAALMVTDIRGYPLELQVATPVRPTRMHRAIYGDSLARYAISELVASPLLRELQTEPDAVVTNHPLALDALSDPPLAYLAAADTFVAGDLYDSQALAPSAEMPSAVLVQPSGADPQPLTDAAALLSRTREKFDPLEVFTRLETTLHTLAETDERYS